MSALWTPGRAGASPWVLRQCPAPPSQVCPHRLLPGACAGVRWPWFDSGPAQSWPKSYLESACSTRAGIYWPRVVRTARRPPLPPVPPTLEQCTQTTTAATTATGPAPSNRPKQQLSHLANAPKRRLEKSRHPKLSEVMRQHRGGASQERRVRSRSSPTRATATAMVPAIPTACRFPRGAQA